MPTVFNALSTFASVGGRGMRIFGSRLNPPFFESCETTLPDPMFKASFNPAVICATLKLPADVPMVEKAGEFINDFAAP